MLKSCKFFFLTIVLVGTSAFASADKFKEIEKIKKAIVTIETRVSVAAYIDTGGWSGTGFIADQKNGLIITNAHVSGRGAVGTYFVTFHNGQQAEAKSVYYDAYADFAVLKVMPQDLPKDLEVIEFAKNEPKLGDEIFIVGNAEGQGFSFHTGYLSDLYDINGDMPQGTYVINMNTTGGASGSPIVNADNKAIGILYGGGKTHALALKQRYLEHALEALKKDNEPKRQHIGMITTLYSLDKAVKHRSFPKDVMDKYIQDNPDSRNRAVSVRTVLPGSTAEEILEAGDIIWEIDGKKVAADLTLVDHLMNDAKDKIKLGIYRDGKKIEKEVKLYDLNKRKVKEMFDFAGGLFFMADDWSSKVSGIPLGSVVAANVQTGSSFSSIPEMFVQNYKSIYRIVIRELNGQKITDLASLVKASSGATKKKHVNVVYENYQPYQPSFSSGFMFISAHEKLMQDITFDSIDNEPRMIRFDDKNHEWVSGK